jgi:hypothetical protein
VRGRRESLDYLADIQEASTNISRFISGMAWEEFAQDQKTIYAVVRAFEIIGEAARSLSCSEPSLDCYQQFGRLIAPGRLNMTGVPGALGPIPRTGLMESRFYPMGYFTRFARFRLRQK